MRIISATRRHARPSASRSRVPRLRTVRKCSCAAYSPRVRLFTLAKVMFIDAWDMRLARARNEQKALHAQIRELENQIDTILDRIVGTSSPKVMKAFEERIESLERQKIRLTEQAAQSVPPDGQAERFIEPLLGFLTNHWNIYKKWSIALKRTVLKLAFIEPLRYSRETGYRTAKTTFPFKVLADFSTSKHGVVGDPEV